MAGLHDPISKRLPSHDGRRPQHYRLSSTVHQLIIVIFAVALTPTATAYRSRMFADDSGTISSISSSSSSKSFSVQCGVCDKARCPELNYCEGNPIKDTCNCCTVCSSSKYQPHVSVVGEDECGKVNCPRFQVCVANMQGLPLCKCPSEFLCRSNRRRTVCGTDGHTYSSKCHMRIASCNQNMMIKKRHRGACTPEDVREGEVYKRKMRRRMRRRERRRKKLEAATAAAAASAATETGGRGGARPTGVGTLGKDGLGGRNDVVSSRKVNNFGPARRGSILSTADGRGGRGRKLGQRNGGGVAPSGDLDESNKGRAGGRDALSKKKRRRRKKKKKKRKQRKARQGGKKEKKERRRRRRKRQHRPKSRSKRHRVKHPRYFDDALAREKAFEEAFGHGTWWA